MLFRTDLLQHSLAGWSGLHDQFYMGHQIATTVTADYGFILYFFSTIWTFLHTKRFLREKGSQPSGSRLASY